MIEITPDKFAVLDMILTREHTAKTILDVEASADIAFPSDH